jgi:hypothetical protein
MGAASAASRRAALRQSFELLAACTADSVYSVSSPTIRRKAHRKSSSGECAATRKLAAQAVNMDTYMASIVCSRLCHRCQRLYLLQQRADFDL